MKITFGSVLAAVDAALEAWKREMVKAVRNDYI